MECVEDMEFGFNDVNFSNKTLQIHIIPDPIRQTHFQKRRRVDTGPEAAKSSHTGCFTTDNKTIHINTLILAAKSPYFRKLFSNGMTETNQHHVTLHIQQSEEPAFMQLLKFMYATTLSNTTPSVLVDVLIAADKYEVASCVKYCLQQLHKLPMTCELALCYLDLPSTILMPGTVQSLTDAAKKFLIAHFKDVSKFREEMLTLPLVAIQAVLSSDDLQVTSEDEIYNFVMKWARRHYTKPDERRDMLLQRLLQLVRFPFMSRNKLEEVLICPDINLEHRSKLVFGAISFETPHRQRAYKHPHVRVIRFNLPREECVAYLDIKREECARLLTISSQTFDFCGLDISLIVSNSQVFVFGLVVRKKKKNLVGCTVEVEFSTRVKPSEEFVSMKKVNVCLTEEGSDFGCTGLHGVPWDTFIAENSTYFINGVIHLRVILKIKKEV